MKWSIYKKENETKTNVEYNKKRLVFVLFCVGVGLKKKRQPDFFEKSVAFGLKNTL